MSPENLPVLYANDSCPYVFRARIALAYAGIDVEHREVDLENKPPSMLRVSPKGTVPVLVLADGAVIDESWSIMQWAVRRHDPDNWCGDDDDALRLAEQLAKTNDGEFGEPSMYYKFASYFPDRNPLQDRAACEPFLDGLQKRLSKQPFMYGHELSLADIPVFPSVSGFATIEPKWFAGRFPHLNTWMERMSALPHIRRIGFGHTPWRFEQAG